MLLPAFFMLKTWNAAEIHSELCTVYGQYVSEGILRQWCRMFKDGRTDVHDEEGSDRRAIFSDFVQSVDQIICESQCLTISECEFPPISRTLLYEIITG
jgi:hypothetical protein